MQTTAKVAHTPGPWMLQQHDPHSPVYVLADSQELGWPVLAEMDSRDIRDKAVQICNARLMAAAPELLKACKALIALGSLSTDGIHKFSREFQQARAAIAKATRD